MQEKGKYLLLCIHNANTLINILEINIRYPHLLSIVKFNDGKALARSEIATKKAFLKI